MADVVDKETRSRMMSGIRAKDTKPELVIRSALHRAGFRFRLHRRDLPGTPDIVLPRYNAVINVHGCFWHYHGCKYSKVPETRTDFWLKKLEANRDRDKKKSGELAVAGWRELVVWECALRSGEWTIKELVADITEWLENDSLATQIPA